jgi:hypothetical protein
MGQAEAATMQPRKGSGVVFVMPLKLLVFATMLDVRYVGVGVQRHCLLDAGVHIVRKVAAHDRAFPKLASAMSRSAPQLRVPAYAFPSCSHLAPK